MRLSVFSLLLLLAGCTFFGRPADPQQAATFQQQAEERVAARDWSGAADLLDEAVNADPHAGSLYLRRGELLERAGEPAASRRVYRQGLDAVAKADPARPALAWRLALLETLRLDAPRKARRLGSKLPEGSAERYDLLGVLALQAKDPRAALEHFNRALATTPGDDIASTILYHASLAYRELGDEKNTFGSLFHAINRAQHLGVIADIERLWNELNTEAAAS